MYSRLPSSPAVADTSTSNTSSSKLPHAAASSGQSSGVRAAPRWYRPPEWRINQPSLQHHTSSRDTCDTIIHDGTGHWWHRQDVKSGNGTGGDADGGKAVATKRRPSKGQALQKLLKLLLSIAGPRILALVGLALARTALSNRLARLQVSRIRCTASKALNISD